jgi:hypothetical protein
LMFYVPSEDMKWSTGNHIWFTIVDNPNEHFTKRVFWHSNSARCILDTIIWYLGLIGFDLNSLERLIRMVNQMCEDHRLIKTDYLKYKERIFSMETQYVRDHLEHKMFSWETQDATVYRRIKTKRGYWDFVNAHDHSLKFKK